MEALCPVSRVCPRLHGELVQQKRLIYYNPTGYSDHGGRSMPFSGEPFPKVFRISLRLYLRHQLNLIIPLCRFEDKSQFLGEDLQEDSFINAINFSGFRCSRKLIWNRGWKALSNIDEGEYQLPIDWWSLRIKESQHCHYAFILMCGMTKTQQLFTLMFLNSQLASWLKNVKSIKINPLTFMP